MRWLVVLVGVSACGRFSFDRLPDDAGPIVPDAAAVDAPLDAPIDAPLDAPLGAFSPGAIIAQFSSGSTDDDPTLTGDMLEIIFESNRGGSEDLYVARRPDLVTAWSAPTAIAALNTGSHDSAPEVSADGLTLLFSSNRPGGLGSWDIYVSTRLDRASPWGAPNLIPQLNSSLEDVSPGVSASGLEVVLFVGPVGNRELWRATRPSTVAPWGTPTVFAEVNSPLDDTDAFFTRSDLDLAFASARVGGAGGADLYLATRTTTSQAFAAAVPLPGVNSASADVDPWLSPDGRTLFFSSDRTGNREIYFATR